MKKTKLLVIFLIIIAAFGAAYFLIYKNPAAHKAVKTIIGIPVPPPPDTTNNPTIPDTVKSGYVLLNVPFTSQAPTGNWSDPREEDGCEEASILMAWLWTQDKIITPVDAEKAILDISDFETAHYGNYADLDAEDTAKLMSDYYHYTKTQVKINPTIDDMKNALRAGELVLVPANGQKLGNPHYKSPGPLTHFLVVKGFDDSKGVFITNDSGTQYGKSYTYPYQTLYNAMVNYPSGDHLSQVGRPKAMIVVSK